MKQSPAQMARSGSMRFTQAEFLRLYTEGHHTASALRQVGRTRNTFDRHWLRDPIFREQYETAKARKAGKGEKGFASTDFINFRQLYFDHATPPHHYRIIEAIETSAPFSVTVVNAPPRSAKTTLLIDYYCYLLGNDPNYRICVLSESQDLARKIIGQVQRRMSDRTFFAGYIERYGPFVVAAEDKKRSGSYDRDVRKPWNADYITVLRASHDEKEPSLESKGATSQIYGARYDLIVCDDLISMSNVNQSADIFDKLRQDAFTRLTERGRLIVLGTRVRSGDLYEMMLGDTDEDGSGFVDNYISIPALNSDAESYWPEERPAAELDTIRRKVGPERWDRVYMQRAVSREGATFSEEAVRACCDDTLRLGFLTDAQGQRLGTEVMGSLDPALAGPACFGVLPYDASHLWLADIEVIANLGSNEAIFRHLARLSGMYRPSEWVIEQDGQGNKALVADERLRELAARNGFRITPHLTTGNKSNHAYGVASMASAFTRREFVLPYGDANSRRKIDELVEELIRWRADVPSRLLPQDRVVMCWFAWKRWLARRKSMTAESKDFATKGLPWSPTTGGIVIGARAS